jgi:hypothetical protein
MIRGGASAYEIQQAQRALQRGEDPGTGAAADAARAIAEFLRFIESRTFVDPPPT